MSEPSPHGLIAALQALWGGAITTLVAALAGRLMFHTGEVRARGRRFFGSELLWELPVAVGMAIIGEAACAWLALTPPVATGVIAALAYLGPRGAETLFDRWLKSRTGGDRGGT